MSAAFRYAILISSALASRAIPRISYKQRRSGFEVISGATQRLEMTTWPINHMLVKFFNFSLKHQKICLFEFELRGYRMDLSTTANSPHEPFHSMARRLAMNTIGRRNSQASYERNSQNNSMISKNGNRSNKENVDLSVAENFNFNSFNYTSDVEISEPNKRRWNPVEIPVRLVKNLSSLR